jgi:DNA-binding transcriptional LysR family regulator
MAENHPTTREVWRPIDGFDYDYSVSSLGRVRSMARGAAKILIPQNAGNGYLHVGMRQHGKQVNRLVHRLVLEAFVCLCPDGCEAAHLDGTRTNNTPGNLEWVTRKVNHSHKILHGTSQRGERQAQHKITRDQAARAIEMAQQGHGATFIARALGIPEGATAMLVTGKNWRWLYAELGVSPIVHARGYFRERTQ